MENTVSPSICTEHVNNNTAGKIGDFDSENHDMCELWNKCENQSMDGYVFCGLKGKIHPPEFWM